MPIIGENHATIEELKGIAEFCDTLNDTLAYVSVEAKVMDNGGIHLGTVKQDDSRGYVFVLDAKP
jgi:hypothetical protein